jgi:hypothetical protein
MSQGRGVGPRKFNARIDWCWPRREFDGGEDATDSLKVCLALASGQDGDRDAGG